MPDRHMTAQRMQDRLVEYLGNKAHVLVHDDARTVADRDPSRLLAAVLKGIEPVVGELADLFGR